MTRSLDEDAPPTARTVARRYEDPLDRIWLTAAARIGLRVDRSAEVYASTDGRGRMTLGSAETLDADDCLAQMIFHELCHSLVQGPESFEQPDWGLDNETDRDLVRERACLRLQASLTGRYGLREVLAPTTDHRAFYDALGADPLAGGETRSIELARMGLVRVERSPWSPHLIEALEATAAVVHAVAPFSSGDSLFARATPRPSLHPSGLPASAAPSARTCGECAWRRVQRGRSRCVQAGKRIDPSWPACERFEAELDCRACGACCREAYGLVELSRRDPFVRLHPELVERVGDRIVLERKNGRCPALEGEGPYTCKHYEHRPRTCRDFERGSDNCLEARRRVGLSL